MVWRNYYRKKEKDPKSLANLERLDDKTLKERQTIFNKTIKQIKEIYDLKTYEKYQTLIPHDKIKQAEQDLITEFLKIRHKILVKKSYYAKKGFFGGLSEGKILLNLTCEKDNQTETFLKQFNKYYLLISKYEKHKEKIQYYNQKITSLTNSLISRDGIKKIRFLRDYDFETITYNLLSILNKKKLNIKGSKGEELEVTSRDFGFFIFDNITNKELDPTNQKIGYKSWDSSVQCSKNEFSKIEDVNKSYFEKHDDFRFAEKKLHLSGKFFVELGKITVDEDYHFTNILNKEKFIDCRNSLLNHYETFERKTTLVQRSRKRRVRIDENFNYVYILSNKSYPNNVFKVGWTTNLPEERADQLSSETGVLYPFKVEYYKSFKNADNVEKKVHKKFKAYRVRQNKEFFEIEINKLKEYLENLDENSK
ncbi:GIY-YIG nuclease family protein [Candidatus Pelagibacter sp. HIMB1321]|uniref:GIY-YIG nuclease family protein n=1 Tax=Candidatus Pelagibacter sp. HIMB1321 TaxID=1388755 RepID=UPI000A07FE3E|nr:GIY-YIG nuclease family protein [Candidatus Pelagibacter sp. HIMB1321]SMF76988.1 T5orf172 domain-containing protein [Candidatus Pelagibacter sp. HIMB1321]